MEPCLLYIRQYCGESWDEVASQKNAGGGGSIVAAVECHGVSKEVLDEMIAHARADTCEHYRDKIVKEPEHVAVSNRLFRLRKRMEDDYGELLDACCDSEVLLLPLTVAKSTLPISEISRGLHRYKRWLNGKDASREYPKHRDCFFLRLCLDRMEIAASLLADTTENKSATIPAIKLSDKEKKEKSYEAISQRLFLFHEAAKILAEIAHNNGTAPSYRQLASMLQARGFGTERKGLAQRLHVNSGRKPEGIPV